jgi:hypothetical protein
LTLRNYGTHWYSLPELSLWQTTALFSQPPRCVVVSIHNPKEKQNEEDAILQHGFARTIDYWLPRKSPGDAGGGSSRADGTIRTTGRSGSVWTNRRDGTGRRSRRAGKHGRHRRSRTHGTNRADGRPGTTGAGRTVSSGSAQIHESGHWQNDLRPGLAR